jgi:hypothetical protein
MGKQKSTKTAELEKLLAREKNAKLICAQLNNFMELKPTLITIIDHIKKLTDIEAVGIRLEDERDYPYYVYNGFPESFIRHENSLCAKDEGGKRIPAPDGNGFLLECMCGNIIRGRFDPSLSFFTPKGSFWSNNTTALLTSSTEEDRQSETKNYCNAVGYQSVALIPIKAKGETIGLIQLNDKREGHFTEDLIEFIEMIGEQIGLAIRNSLTYTKLKNALDEIKALRRLLPICAGCKKIRDDKGFWHAVEVYFHEHAHTDFTHSMCPECIKKLYPKVAREMDI